MTDAIRRSTLPAAVQSDVIELLESSKAATNGLDERGKIQAVSECLFATVNMLALVLVESSKNRAATWRDVIIACRWQILGIALFAVLLFIIRPNVAVEAMRNREPAEVVSALK